MAKEVTKKEERTEEAVEKAAVKAEKNTLKAARTSGFVKVMFGLDPTMKGNQFLEYCINGIIYRYPRGVVVEVPTAVFETIERKERGKRMSMQTYSGFEGSGKELDV